jgi:hypothetical protein
MHKSSLAYKRVIIMSSTFDRIISPFVVSTSTEVAQRQPNASNVYYEASIQRATVVDTSANLIGNLPGMKESQVAVGITATKQEKSDVAYQPSTNAAHTPPPVPETAPRVEATVKPQTQEATIVDFDKIKRIEEAQHNVEAATSMPDQFMEAA